MIRTALYNQGLVYHKVSDEFEWGLTTVSPSAFRRQMLDLRRNGFAFKRVHELLPLQSKERKVAITFDDGYESVYTEAFPILNELQIPGTVFIITDFVGRSNNWDWQIGGRTFRHLSWSEIHELQSAGWEIGSHTVSHRILTNISSEEVSRELTRSKDILEQKLGIEIKAICPPFNRFNQTILELAREAGYEKCAVSFPLESPPQGFENFIVQRLGVYHHEWRSVVRGKLVVNAWTPLVILQQQIINLAAQGTEIRKRLAGQ
ncbi:MAG: polysaccharide deacetylase family protein [Candidatus Marinimicrobia bacterium]|nr:polysaccharide deacetylase family protein [Candidatus Neomarinimicrobiota bacterium]MCF7839717.1 polysaccharide deacetylase family protein [Candidatus Neomarinimicrobiota bacterium]